MGHKARFGACFFRSYPLLVASRGWQRPSLYQRSIIACWPSNQRAGQKTLLFWQVEIETAQNKHWHLPLRRAQRAEDSKQITAAKRQRGEMIQGSTHARRRAFRSEEDRSSDDDESATSLRTVAAANPSSYRPGQELSKHSRVGSGSSRRLDGRVYNCWRTGCDKACMELHHNHLLRCVISRYAFRLQAVRSYQKLQETVCTTGTTLRCERSCNTCVNVSSTKFFVCEKEQVLRVRHRFNFVYFFRAAEWGEFPENPAYASASHPQRFWYLLLLENERWTHQQWETTKFCWNQNFLVKAWFGTVWTSVSRSLISLDETFTYRHSFMFIHV